MSTLANPSPSRVAGRLARMSSREQVLIAAMVATAILMIAALLIVQRTRRLNAIREESAGLQEASALVRSEASNYQRKQKERSKRSSDVPNEPLAWGTRIDEAESSLGVKASGFDDSMASVPLNDDIERKDAKFDLRTVTMSDLAAFLRTLEQTPSYTVLTQDLTLRSTSGHEEDRLNATVTMSSWNRRATSKSAAADDGAAAPAPTSAAGGAPEGTP